MPSYTWYLTGTVSGAAPWTTTASAGNYHTPLGIATNDTTIGVTLSAFTSATIILNYAGLVQQGTFQSGQLLLRARTNRACTTLVKLHSPTSPSSSPMLDSSVSLADKGSSYLDYILPISSVAYPLDAGRLTLTVQAPALGCTVTFSFAELTFGTALYFDATRRADFDPQQDGITPSTSTTHASRGFGPGGVAPISWHAANRAYRAYSPVRVLARPATMPVGTPGVRAFQLANNAEVTVGRFHDQLVLGGTPPYLVYWNLADARGGDGGVARGSGIGSAGLRVRGILRGQAHGAAAGEGTLHFIQPELFGGTATGSGIGQGLLTVSVGATTGTTIRFGSSRLVFGSIPLIYGSSGTQTLSGSANGRALNTNSILTVPTSGAAGTLRFGSSRLVFGSTPLVYGTGGG
jgi:hypothetical protein